MQNRKNLYLYLTFAIIAALGIIAAVVFTPSNEVKKLPKQSIPKRLAKQVEKSYSTSVLENVKVPNKTDKNTTSTKEIEKNIAIPEVQTQAAPGVEAELRKFSVKAENNVFMPNKIIVYKGDTVHIEFSAVDKDYDFSIPAVYGISRQVKKGNKAPLEFQAYQEGQFDIICKLCGDKKMGTLIVVPRK